MGDGADKRTGRAGVSAERVVWLLGSPRVGAWASYLTPGGSGQGGVRSGGNVYEGALHRGWRAAAYLSQRNLGRMRRDEDAGGGACVLHQQHQRAVWVERNDNRRGLLYSTRTVQCSRQTHSTNGRAPSSPRINDLFSMWQRWAGRADQSPYSPRRPDWLRCSHAPCYCQ